MKVIGLPKCAGDALTCEAFLNTHEKLMHISSGLKY